MASAEKVVHKSWVALYNLHSILGILLLVFLFMSFYLIGDSNNAGKILANKPIRKNSSPKPKCNLFSGSWVFDNVSYPLYKEQRCSFMTDDFACHKFGRKDSKFQHWRWQPHDCDLPRFNAKALLEKLKGKRVLFVGDSLNKNQWVSMVCLIESSGIPSLKPPIWKGNLITFEVKEYNATIDFYWSPLLVESNCDDPVKHRVRDRIIRIEAIEKHARHWIDADILIFDSFTWWLESQMTLLWGSFESSDAIYKRVGMKLRRYGMALRTWSDWLEFQIDRKRTRLFFMSLSPPHRNATDWGMGIGENCYNETEPISRKQHWGSENDVKMMKIAEEAVNGLQKRGLDIQYLNITQLSDYRKDAHPSIYKRNWVALTKEELLNPRSYADCVHWCLPGVPDIWNQILYAYIMESTKEKTRDFSV
ncbi:PREDICTED: protein trichome birefringence-like 34 [Nicotiana attenuata]|uniref:Protein trichome birefringence-like 34 n=1 Tax=Nicotiana attenuata TaxID=49451 RepID=A0A314KRP3_NICAT|nr:PREDICTED: protein trichome birefringence-like 34 [Nicotiana attenuata]OIT31757.1 protein trichome birefringence-like 34 [Nicotiana attenuata]